MHAVSQRTRGARLATALAATSVLSASLLASTTLLAQAASAATDPVQALSGPIVAAIPEAGVPAIVPTAAVPAAVPVVQSAVIPPALAIAAKQAAFLDFTVASPQTLDRRGVEPSLYKGRFFRSSLEDLRKCIVRRESSGVYTVRGGGGDRYYGAYQMNDRLADGATWMMLPEAKKLIGEKAASTLMAKLRSKPVTQWPRYWQDAAFFTIYNWEHTGSGRNHWAGGRWRC